jgi:hypothetical protein
MTTYDEAVLIRRYFGARAERSWEKRVTERERAELCRQTLLRLAFASAGLEVALRTLTVAIEQSGHKLDELVKAIE